MFTKEMLISQLEALEVPRGAVVLVHTSLKAVGEVEGGGLTVLEALREVFCRDGGLLCVPTHTWDEGILDLRKNETCIGVLPNLAAGHPDGVRTHHPTHSMAVFGEKERVEAYIRGEAEAQTPAPPDGCYGRLVEEDGYVLLLGVGHNKNTFLHSVEEMLEVPNRLTETKRQRKVIHPDGREEVRHIHTHFAQGIRDVSAQYPKYEPAFRHYGCVKDGIVGSAPVQLCSARKMKEVVALVRRRSGGQELLQDLSPLGEELYL